MRDWFRSAQGLVSETLLEDAGATPRHAAAATAVDRRIAGAGAALGVAGAVCTWIRSADGHLFIRAGAISAILWVLGMGARMRFQVWVEHGDSVEVARFSTAHHITSSQTWVAALVLMAVTEVVTRLATIFIRSGMVARPGTVAVSGRQDITQAIRAAAAGQSVLDREA